MIKIFEKIDFDWLGHRRLFIFLSIAVSTAGLASAVVRQALPGGTDAFNLGVDFKGGTVVTAKFKKRPQAEAIRDALTKVGVEDAIIQPVTSKPDEVLIKVPQMSAGNPAAPQDQAQVDIGRTKVAEALNALGPEAGAWIEGTESVGPIAGRQLRNQAITVTLLACVGILIYIAFRFDAWAYGAAAVLAVFHDVLITLAFFSIFQWEVSLTVIAALLTLVGFSVNDTIVTFDRIRENLRLHRRDSLYKITNDAINQTMSRTIITSGLVFLSVLAMVLFGGEVLRGFSLTLLIGIIAGTYSTIGVASPIMLWLQKQSEAARQMSASPVRQNADRGAGARVGRGPERQGETLKSPQGAARP
jgi:preprotein translocase subunit SecF